MEIILAGSILGRAASSEFRVRSFSADWSKPVLDFLRHFAVVSGIVAVGHVGVALCDTIGAGEPS